MAIQTERQAAVFDFDGVIFHQETRWKVIHPRAGRLGSGVHWTKACAMYEQFLQTAPNATLNEIFHLDEFSFRYAIPDHIDNRMPMDSINQTARSHASRRRDILILSGHYYPGLDRFLDGLYNTFRRDLRPGELPIPKDPFKDSRSIFPDHTTPVLEVSEKKSILKKMELLSNLLYRHEDGEDRPDEEECENQMCRYDRLHLYYTEPKFYDYINDYLRENMEYLSGGRNSIVPYLITGEPSPGT